MKQTIAWHQDGLKSWKKSLEDERIRLENLTKAYYRSKAQIDFYEMQINSAIAEGKDGFDSERYKKPKVKP